MKEFGYRIEEIICILVYFYIVWYLSIRIVVYLFKYSYNV